MDVAVYTAMRRALTQNVAPVQEPELSRAGKIAALGIAATALVLLISSALDTQLGLPAAIAGASTTLIVRLHEKKGPAATIKNVSWAVLPLVAGLFVLALGNTKLKKRSAAFCRWNINAPPPERPGRRCYYRSRQQSDQ